MKSIFNYFSIALIMSLTTTSLFAISGSRNGGETIRRENQRIFRDLVDDMSCETWNTSKKMLELVPYFEKNVLPQLKRVNWYLAFDLKRQLDKLAFCMTGELVSVDTEDRLAITTVYSKNDNQSVTELAAIRLVESDEVYINKYIFNDPTFTQRSKAALLVHETLHSYLPQDEERRNFKIRTMTKLIMKVASGIEISPSDFDWQLQQSNMRFPLDSMPYLNPNKDGILFSLNSYEYQRSQVLASKDISKLFNNNKQTTKYLLQEDERKIEFITEQIFLATACKKHDTQIINKFSKNHNPNNGFDPILSCIGALNPSSKKDLAFISKLLENRDSLKLINGLLTVMSKKDVYSQKYRLFGNKYLSQLGSSANTVTSDQHLMEILPLHLNEKNKMSYPLKGMINLVAKMIIAKDWAKIDSIILSNEQFYQAFEINSILDQIENENCISREILPAKKQLKELVTKFFNLWFTYFKQYGISQTEINRFKNNIDFAKIGITL